MHGSKEEMKKGPMTVHRKIVPGWRYFECPACNEQWRSKCRDCETESYEFCSNCYELAEPFKSESHPEWPVDKHGNLLEEE